MGVSHAAKLFRHCRCPRYSRQSEDREERGELCIVLEVNNGEHITDYFPYRQRDKFPGPRLSRFRVRLMGSAVSPRASDDKKGAEPMVAAAPEDHVQDLVDIRTTESSQEWRIADKMENTTRKP